MADEYLPDFGIDAIPPASPPPAATGSAEFDRERLRFLLMGSPEWIQEVIHRLHQCNIAEVGLWSRLLPAPDSEEMMSILILYRRRNG